MFRRYGPFEVGASSIPRDARPAVHTGANTWAVSGTDGTDRRGTRRLQGERADEKRYALGRRKGLGATAMTVEQENQRILNGEAQRLAEHLDGTAEALPSPMLPTALGRETVVSIFPRVADTPFC